ncbi:hypothetical protein IT570_13105 [Candidatus Sumerlaeota bacterium]|nr:hypothetical protein [Candidatus Sumerlaeota bacterium]
MKQNSGGWWPGIGVFSRPAPPPAGFHNFLCLLAAIVALTGCTPRQKFEAYSPHENILSIAAEFGLLSSLDPYRDDVGRDLTGQSIARSTLVRLANYEALHPGRLTPEVLAYKGRALELLGEFESAQRNYREAAEYETELKEDCQRRIDALGRLIVAGGIPPANANLEDTINFLGSQAGEYRQLSRSFTDGLYQSLALREAESAELRRSELMIANRHLLIDGEQQAQKALEDLIAGNKESSRSLEHALRLAHYHRELAEEEVRLHQPELGGFSLERFKAHYDAAVDLLYRISQADGRRERLVARHELDALLEYGGQIEARAR